MFIPCYLQFTKFIILFAKTYVMENLTQFRNVLELVRTFDTEEKCREYLTQIRWNGSPKCPHCNHEKIYIYKDNKMYKCASCKKQFNVLTKTIFQSTHIDLRDWFYAMYVFVNHKKGESARQMAKDLLITRKSAWFLLQRIRHSMKQRGQKLFGEIEVDETFVGGKNKNRHYNKRVKHSQGRSLADKAGIYGILQRDGRVITIHLGKLKGKGMRLLLTKFVDKDSTIYSDEFKNYNGLDKLFKSHKRVNHGAYQYADGDTYTNTIECFWSHLKRGIVSTYHSVSKHKLFRYCHEFEFRWNTRHESDPDRFNVVLTQSFGRRLTWGIATTRTMRKMT